jgi:hypothetical protein
MTPKSFYDLTSVMILDSLDFAKLFFVTFTCFLFELLSSIEATALKVTGVIVLFFDRWRFS